MLAEKDVKPTAKSVERLMGNKAETRFAFIQENAEFAKRGVAGRVSAAAPALRILHRRAPVAHYMTPRRQPGHRGAPRCRVDPGTVSTGPEVTCDMAVRYRHRFACQSAHGLISEQKRPCGLGAFQDQPEAGQDDAANMAIPEGLPGDSRSAAPPSCRSMREAALLSRLRPSTRRRRQLSPRRRSAN